MSLKQLLLFSLRKLQTFLPKIIRFIETRTIIKRYNPKNKKIAVIMSGFLRNYEMCAPYIVKNILEPLNADLFVYCPYERDSDPAIQYEIKSIVKDLSIITENDISKYYNKFIKTIKMYNYNINIFSEQESKILNSIDKDQIYPVDIFQTVGYMKPSRFLSQLYHFWQSDLLRQTYEYKNNIQYDLVIKIRPDILPWNKINLSSIDSNKLNYPIGQGFNMEGLRYIGAAHVFAFYNLESNTFLTHHQLFFNDHIFITKSNQMSLISNLYNNVMNYIINNKIAPNNETLIAYHSQYINNIQLLSSDFIQYNLASHKHLNCIKRFFLPNFVIEDYKKMKGIDSKINVMENFYANI